MANQIALKGERSSAAGKELLWRRMVRQQASSGMSVRAWCRQHQINESAFYWWRRELARRDAEQAPSTRQEAKQSQRKRLSVKSGKSMAKASKSPFVPVHIADGTTAHGDTGRIEILLPDGRCIRIHGSVDRQMLADVLSVLTSASAVESERRAC